MLTASIPFLHPDHPLDTALRLIGEWPLLPVVHRADTQKLLGVVSLDDVVRAYRGAGVGLSRPPRSTKIGVIVPTSMIEASGTQYFRQVVITWSMASRAASSGATS